MVKALRTQLIVAGFHRSGTSLVCQLLNRAGLFLGYDLLGPTFSNPHGHFEDTEIMDFHEQLLGDNGRTWLASERFLPIVASTHWRRLEQIIERRNSEHELWGFKDPRVCLFMMVWKHLLPNAKVLMVYRSFSDSAYSLGRRQSVELLSDPTGPARLYGRFWEEPDLALRMWLAHNEALLTFARTYPEDTLAVSLDMVQNGFTVIKAANQRWGLRLNEVPTSEVINPAVMERRVGRQPISDRRLIERIDATWQALEQLSAQTGEIVEEQRSSRTPYQPPPSS